MGSASSLGQMAPVDTTRSRAESPSVRQPAKGGLEESKENTQDGNRQSIAESTSIKNKPIMEKFAMARSGGVKTVLAMWSTPSMRTKACMLLVLLLTASLFIIPWKQYAPVAKRFAEMLVHRNTEFSLYDARFDFAD